MAEAHAAVGRLEDALRISAQTLDHIHRVNERAFEPESHRVRGELLLRQGGAAECDRRRSPKLFGATQGGRKCAGRIVEYRLEIKYESSYKRK
jgi:hypothetical protein